MLSSCHSIPTSKPIAPIVDIESVEVLKIGLREQQLAFRLNVINPNSYDLPLQSLSFLASVDGTKIAQGASNERVNLPANQAAIVEISVKTRINKLLTRLLALSRSETDDVTYDVIGFVKLANWPARIPFNVDGTVENPVTQQ